MLQEFITKAIFFSDNLIICPLWSPEIMGRGIVDLIRNFQVFQFSSFRTSITHLFLKREF